MTPEQIRFGLEQYTSPLMNPQEMMTVHTAANGHQTGLSWHHVARAALDYFDAMEELCAAAAQTMSGSLFIQIKQENNRLRKENQDLEARNKRQAEALREKEKK